jgi:hypothetical protein
MNETVTTIEIQTLGRFVISDHCKPVAADWPDEPLKQFFGSLLSPSDLYVSWDRLCSNFLGVPDSRTSRPRLKETCLRPLIRFLIKELGFNPLIIESEGIRIDHQRVHVDAFEFRNAAVEGLQLFSNDKQVEALNRFNRAKSLYAGSFLTGMSNKIIVNTRNDLESLYLTAILDTMPLILHPGFSGYKPVTDPGQYMTHERRPFHRLIQEQQA